MRASPRLRFALAASIAGLAACAPDAPAPDAAPPSATVAASAASPTSRPQPGPRLLQPPAETAALPVASGPPAREIVGAAQILVTWKGAELGPKTVTRSKDEARKRADEALAALEKDPGSFEQLVKTYSDDEASKKAGGALGNFERNAMPAAFSAAAFDLKVGETSKVVETPRGFHIIKRVR